MRANWAGNVVYRAKEFSRPSSVGELRQVVVRASRIRALGTRHSFSEVADSADAQVSVAELPPVMDVDTAAARVEVAAGIRYAELAAQLDKHDLALPSMASLPHISVGGACATATHGSGLRTGALPTTVSALELVTADGELRTLDRTDPRFPGAVVSLGALGVVTKLTLDLVPAFEVAQRVYEQLPLAALDGHLDELLSDAYSVCLFTDWRGPWLTQVWLQRRLDEPAPATPGKAWFTAAPAAGPRHPVAGVSAESCTIQQGEPGRWFERLPHFRADREPSSSGRELQSEYLIPVGDTLAALRALDSVRERIAPVLQVCEVRTIAADDLWLSPFHGAAKASIHFTWVEDVAVVRPVLGLVEDALAPFGAIPHWAKLFTTRAETVRQAYPRLPDFRALAAELDPDGKFRNRFLDHYLFPPDDWEPT